MYDYTTKEERLDARFEACREEYSAEIRQLMRDGFNGNTAVRMPRVKYVNKVLNIGGHTVASGHEVIVYDQAFPVVVGDCIANDICMAYLLAASRPGAEPAGLLAVFRESCADVYLKENLDDIVRCAWDRRDEV